MEWANKNNFEKYISESRIERTLAAYTYVVGLADSTSDGIQLFGVMQALEAFYIDGHGDMRRQLSEKVKLWLGRWENNTNIVGRLYDVRLTFVHGTAKLISWNRDKLA
ncbi:hypothetical protein [Oxalobacter paraformigenes]|uniref:hypothetical protein n=1 Tax=Oxalobacter paraformigenes TaxID=556268 RepID=UPI0011C73FD4|nr:hypothetical protein [Oxalobacter paraformigenes]